MKCDMCNGSGEIPIVECGFPGKDECPQCHGKGYLTNAEYMRQCDDSSLAFKIWEFIKDGNIDSLYSVEHWLKEKCNDM